ncbi:MAG TPA: TylF/MycF/NovP-related O-methyltransferase [Afifellaceae bacterium]|nr:TylF/MycF/NovP-related O-methyltransferase [Afifellaceae bacterium]
MKHWLKKTANASAKWALRPLGLELRRSGIRHFPEATAEEATLIERFRPYTMISEQRQWSLLKAIDYIDRRAIPGDIVECGVWRGGNMMMVKAYRAKSPIRRRQFLYDTFAGMTEPTGHDVSADGRQPRLIHRKRQRDEYNAWAYASLEEVTENFRRFGLLDEEVLFTKGRVEETLRGKLLPEEIAVLRLDTDWYESTKVELEVLYPRLRPGGVLIIDDYGTWLGAEKAVNEYFGRNGPFLVAIDSGCRIAIKA